MRLKRVLLVSCSIILLCTCIISGMTYALFSDSLTVKNHLQAGELDVTLTRTSLKYSVLNEDGELEVIELSGKENEIDFTETTDENVFGLNGTDKRVVPGSYFEAKMKFTNAGNVAFTYDVKIQLTSAANNLTSQMQVVVTHPDGTQTTKMLSELSSSLTVATGKMLANDTEQTFSVKLTFLDKAENNVAKGETAIFDLIVTANQATE